jgi:exodeoxyribonuclease-3
MRIATWNVNSIRARQERVIDWLKRSDTDVLAMQEIKCKPDQFPLAVFEEAGYEVAIHGLNQWNGVAIASRVGLADVRTSFEGQPAFGKGDQEPVVEARALGATCAGVQVWSLYVPNGRGLTDPHYTYKLEFLRTLRAAASQWHDTPTALMGDWNVAPLPEDIWNEEDSEAETHVTVEARAAFAAFEQAGFEEVSRRFIPAADTYTFWDYKQLRFPKGEGMRIDFIYASPSLAARATAVQIVRDERKGKGASDHVPVVMDLDADGTAS